MRKIVLVIFVLFLSVACEDQRVNQAIDKISRTWTVYKYEKDGIDITPVFTSNYVNYILTCEKSQDYTESFILFGTPVTITGIYIFSDQAQILTLSDEFQSRVFDIITLNNSDMTLQDINSDTTEVYYFEAVI